ncbi:MAG TPA: Fpg/Nei family DNA glycosylase [candidate division WOR-3 bacterium]|uniref:Fpg/Nei family DNA glycosylase n=1 Tax=candidate division WOR-3 bacterium TaxID=2052148 RepID=A0A7V0XFH7_UNCW3|nr:Fpg/Nei family DNA glycosylase [candidate division WOR-3 bacterium]
MLELPEIEVTKDRLRLALAGRVIAGAELRVAEALGTAEPPLATLAGRHVRSVSRHGRFLAIAAEGNLHLCLHPATGRLALGPSAAPWTRHHLAALHLDRAEDLRLIEPGPVHRPLLHLVGDPGAVEGIARLGPDPLGPTFTLTRFRSALGRRNRPLKRFLTDQRVLGGVGNCYADEILHEARLSPLAAGPALRADEAIRLYVAVKKVLQEAVLNLRRLARFPDSEDRSFLRVHGRAGRPCPSCGGTVRRFERDGLTADYCPNCQAGGRDRE